MISSGTTAKATTDDTSVVLLAKADMPRKANLTIRIVNEGAVAGFYSVDGGAAWARLPASSIVEDQSQEVNGSLLMKRVASGSNLSGVYASAWEV